MSREKLEFALRKMPLQGVVVCMKKNSCIHMVCDVRNKGLPLSKRDKAIQDHPRIISRVDLGGGLDEGVTKTNLR